MMQISKSILIVAIGALTLVACNSGGSSSAVNPSPSPSPTAAPATLAVSTFTYNPGDKTGVNVSIGGSDPIIAEVDTGSNLTVVNESAVRGANIQMTSESLTLSYGGGINTVSGYIGYGSVSFTTTNGAQLTSSPQTPILVVTQGTVNLGGGNNAILGMQLNNQTSVRLFLPSPYNQMMLLNKPQSQLIFGQLSFAQLSEFANIQLESETCQNHQVTTSMNNTCWMTESIPVEYTYSQTGLPDGHVTIGTLFDSGAGNAMFQFSSQPSWLQLQGSVIQNTITAKVGTSQGVLPLPLTSTMIYESNTDNKVNAGNNLFNTYQVLFDQTDGIIGLLAAESAL